MNRILYFVCLFVTMTCFQNPANADLDIISVNGDISGDVHRVSDSYLLRIKFVNNPTSPPMSILAVNLYEFSTGIDREIGQGITGAGNTQLTDKYAAWVQFSQGDNKDHIMIYDIAKDTLLNVFKSNQFPRIEGLSKDRLLFTENTVPIKMFVYDITTNQIQHIAPDAVRQFAGNYSDALREDKVVWPDHRNNSTDIRMLDLGTRVETVAVANISTPISVHLSKNYLAWITDLRTSTGNGRDSEISIRSLKTQSTRTLFMNRTVNSSNAKHLSFLGDNCIVWADLGSDQRAPGVYLYDIVQDDLQLVRPTVDFSRGPFSPVASESKILWAELNDHFFKTFFYTEVPKQNVFELIQSLEERVTTLEDENQSLDVKLDALSAKIAQLENAMNPVPQILELGVDAAITSSIVTFQWASLSGDSSPNYYIRVGSRQYGYDIDVGGYMGQKTSLTVDSRKLLTSQEVWVSLYAYSGSSRGWNVYRLTSSK